MLILLLGPDDFSKKQYIAKLAEDSKANVESFDIDNAPQSADLGGSDLFSKPKMFVLRNLIAKYNASDVVEKLVKSKNQVLLVEDKLDKRISANKELLANKSVTVKEFPLPHGQELNRWISDRVKALGAGITPAAVEALAIALGRDEARETKAGGKIVAVEEIYSLWQADSEISKLIALAKDREITEADVKVLTNENKAVDVFDLTNAIAENQKQKAMELLHKFLGSQGTTEEKAAVIQLNALLSEQFRNVAAVQDFISRKTSESEILEHTGWKSGRLFIMKKAAGRFPPKKILDTLNKLSALDEELKTSQTPPKVLLDLIMSQLFV